MNITTIGDQARLFSHRMATSRLSTTLDVLVNELASKQTADIGKKVNGNTSLLSHIETRMQANEGILKGLDEAMGSIDIVLSTLDEIHSSVVDLSTDLINDPASGNLTQIRAKSQHAEDVFNLTVSRLNEELGGQYLFAGRATGQRPLAPASEILAHLETEVSSLTTVEEVAEAVNTWFDAPSGSGGFMDYAYYGDQLERNVVISHAEVLKYSATAADENIRDTLKGLALTSLVGRGIFDGDMAQQRELLLRGGNVIYDSTNGLLDAQAEIGYVASTIKFKQTEIAAHSTELDFLRGDIRKIDEYETALAITDVHTRLQMVYELISRLSKLKLMDYIR